MNLCDLFKSSENNAKKIYIFSELNDALIEHECDLIVIEGMGRALHTNLHAKFKCDVLKCVVIKNQWLAKSLFGGDIFSVIFKYERAEIQNSPTDSNNC